jgi:phosphoribosylamine--glycine ligase
VVGPEAVLSSGITDEFEKNQLRIFGPNKQSAQIESSKVFAKELMAEYGIPTASFKVFSEPGPANDYIEKLGACVVKADGLAQGKGVVVAKNAEEAKFAVSSIMESKVFGDAGSRVIIEECLEGEEASILVLTDSREVVALALAQDHKRVFDGDSGPNTGGMGAYSPAPLITPALFKNILEKIVYATIDAMVKKGLDYKGVLYTGIMVTASGPKVLEFNARFGDPETQAIIPRLNSDLFELLTAVVTGNLKKYLGVAGPLKWDRRSAVSVVCASGGYPGKYEKGKEISGLEETAQMKDVLVFHSGTLKEKNSGAVKYFTNGGRVLAVTGLADTISDAIKKTYSAVRKINFEGMHYRTDIGAKALKH